MASCVRNICTKNYQNLVIGFQVTVKNVGDVFWGTQCGSGLVCWKPGEQKVASSRQTAGNFRQRRLWVLRIL